MNKQESNQFKEDVDGWIKSFKGDLQKFSAELDDSTSEVNTHREELQFHFENLCRLENRIDKVEELLENVLGALKFNQSTTDTFSNIQPLKDKQF